MAFIVPYSFTGGKSAKAQEVNANFVAIQNEFNKQQNTLDQYKIIIDNIQDVYALKSGSINETFNVAIPTNDYHAVNKIYLDTLIRPIKYIVSGLQITKTGNKAFTISIGACYNSTGTYPMELDSQLSIDITELTLTAGNVYNVYAIASTDGSLAINVNKITTAQVTRTTPIVSTTTIYKLIGTITLNTDGNISSTTSVGGS